MNLVLNSKKSNTYIFDKDEFTKLSQHKVYITSSFYTQLLKSETIPNEKNVNQAPPTIVTVHRKILQDFHNDFGSGGLRAP